jgi:hypothetical protein
MALADYAASVYFIRKTGAPRLTAIFGEFHELLR